MKRYYTLFSFRAVLFSFSALLLLASCSSYQYAGYEDDGIYSSNRNEAYTANDYEESYENALYYKQLFGEKAEQFGNVPEEGAIFTDIESYSSGAYDDNFDDQGLDYTVGQASWGSDPDEISINIYNDPFYPRYYSPYYAGFYDPFYYPGYYYGYGYYPYHYNSWRFSIGWGYGWNSWWYGYPHYRYSYGGYYHPYYSHYYYPYYNHRRLAYNTSRRDSYSGYTSRRDSYSDYRSNRTRLEARSTRTGRYTNPRNVRARSNYDERTYQTNTRRVNSDYGTQRRSNPTYNTNRRSSNATQVRTNRSRSNNTSVRRSSRSSGNTSSVRSSSSSSRSSGSSSSSRSSRGRGN